MSGKTAVLLLAAGAVLIGGASAAAGLVAGRTAPPGTPIDPYGAAAAPPPILREFVPLPAPGDQPPGLRPQPQQGECEPVILFYHDGRLYQLQPGPQEGQGRPGTPPEFYRLNPYQGPPIPGLPFPRQDRGPGFSPVNPRS